MIIYFHGLGSSGATKKVDVFKNAGLNCVAPDIPIDFEEANVSLVSFIKGAIASAKALGDDRVIFVGTSLGGYWAARMGAMFDAEQVLINPSFTPKKSLEKYTRVGYYVDYASGETRSITRYETDRYEDIDPDDTPEHRTYFIAKNDPVVSPVAPHKNSVAVFYDSDDHQGNSFFDDVVEYVVYKMEKN